MGRAVNVGDCALTERFEQGEYRFGVLQLTDLVGGRVIGAAVYEVAAGDRMWPYHVHHGVEEWLTVVAGAPVLRSPAGERALAPGELVAFPTGPDGAHALRGPGRVVMFSVGARGFGEAFVTEYPDSGKVGAAPGVLFRRGDAVGAAAVAPARVAGGGWWAATRVVLAPGGTAGPYAYDWCRETWVLVVRGAPTLRRPAGATAMRAGDLVCFAEGPDGARGWANDGEDDAELLAFVAPADRPSSTVFPEDGTVEIRTSATAGLRFRARDRIEDYWDGEPGA